MILRTRHNPAARRRAGFTLLEILLASLLAALLLAALYAAMHTTLQQTQVTRDAVESENLSRGVFNKITIDLSGTLAPLPPKSGGNSAASGGTTTAASTASTASTDPAASATGTTAAATDPATAGATDSATAFTAAPLFQGGVVGQEQLLVLFLGKVPETFGRYGETGQVRADQRQVIYKFVSGRGLYRVERPWVTADNMTLDLDPDAPDAVLLAEEVVELLFEFCDGTSWVSTWDGTVPGPDGVTPLGPPRAVRVTLTLTIPSGKGELTKQVSQVIAVRSAPGTYTPPLLEAPTDGASGTTTDTTGGGTTGGSTTGGSTPSTPAASSTPAAGKPGGSTPSIPSGASAPAVPSGGSIPSIPSLPSGGASGGKTGGSTGGTGGGTSGSKTGGSTGGTTGGGK